MTTETTTRRYPFVQLDVFTSRALEGNQLAVFTDGRGLTDAEMQALAREMNLSETTFIIPKPENAAPSDPVRVRIFTVEEELPFAGHPTLGTAAVIRGSSGATQVVLDLRVGHISVTFEDGEEGAFGEMRQRDPEFGSIHLPEEVAAAVGLRPGDLDPSLPIQTVSTGMGFTMVPVRELKMLQKLRLNWSRAAEYLERTDGKFFYLVSRETVDPEARLHARMIFYNGEDPATGSAAGCCAAWMVAHGVAQAGERALIEQGTECKRPSRIFVRADKNGDRVTNVRVGGYCVEVMRGEVVL
ncbi:MAG TPA: PhzF family phenazine biosynthesis protein [Terriglobales bacterium]|nr:PhzF family phenazine biosynthesis protein [Terriglobales bacterium]